MGEGVALPTLGGSPPAIAIIGGQVLISRSPSSFKNLAGLTKSYSQPLSCFPFSIAAATASLTLAAVEIRRLR